MPQPHTTWRTARLRYLLAGLLTCVLQVAGGSCARSQHDLAEGVEHYAAGPERHVRVSVLYATNRAMVPRGTLLNFYANRPALPARVHHGICTVSIPRTHSMGDLERPRWLQSWDPDKHVTVVSIAPNSADACYRWLADQMATTGQKDLLVYVHGYYNSFSDAATRTAQLSYDLGFNGVPALFSWPSLESVGGYVADEEAAQVAVPHLAEFLRRTAAESGAGRVFIVGHSLGARAVTQAIRLLNDDPTPAPAVTQLVLAAPDINQDLFRDQILPELGWVNSGITVYASSNDWALRTSAGIHNANRLGQSRPPLCLVDGVEFIDATAYETDLGLNHSNALEVPMILQDLFQCTVLGVPAERRNLRERFDGARRYWALPTP